MRPQFPHFHVKPNYLGQKLYIPDTYSKNTMSPVFWWAPFKGTSWTCLRSTLLSRVRLFFREPVFMNMQLYVVLSRVKSRDELKKNILDKDNGITNRTSNVVFRKVFENLRVRTCAYKLLTSWFYCPIICYVQTLIKSLFFL